MDGILLVDKPAGLTSADVVARIKRLTNISRVGHAGTLDPMATGLLVLLLGKGTRFQDLILTGIKAYSGVIRFGISTDTDDITGREIERSDNSAFFDPVTFVETKAQLEKQFLGKQLQVPPIYSAIKVDGQRNYKLAREGKPVKVQPRDVEILSLNLAFQSPNQLSYQVRCSKGTYVRSLARDIGKSLGIPACLEEIRRIESAPYSLADALPLQDFVDPAVVSERLIPLRHLVGEMEPILLNPAEAKLLRFGDQRVLQKAASLTTPEAPIFVLGGELIGMAEKKKAANGISAS